MQHIYKLYLYNLYQAVFVWIKRDDQQALADLTAFIKPVSVCGGGLCSVGTKTLTGLEDTVRSVNSQFAQIILYCHSFILLSYGILPDFCNKQVP